MRTLDEDAVGTGMAGAEGRPDRVASIRDAILDAIVGHRLVPGTKLSEDEVGAIFGVSRTLVRAALQALAFEGVVKLERNRGAFVARPGADEARQVFDARRMIEPGIARAAARRFDAAWRARLLAHLDEEDAQLAAPAPARRTEIRLSGDFHLLVAAIAGNEVLARFLRELVSRSSLVVSLYGVSGTSSCGAADHRAIFAALDSGDGERAAELMRHHLDHIEADLDLDKLSRPSVDLAEILAPS